MQIETEVKDDVIIVRVIGDITLGKGGDVILKDKINSLLQQGHRKILLDLGKVSYVDSAGLGQLVQMHATTTTAAAVLKLLNVHQTAARSARRDEAAPRVRHVRERGGGAGELREDGRCLERSAGRSERHAWPRRRRRLS